MSLFQWRRHGADHRFVRRLHRSVGSRALSIKAGSRVPGEGRAHAPRRTLCGATKASPDSTALASGVETAPQGLAAHHGCLRAQVRQGPTRCGYGSPGRETAPQEPRTGGADGIPYAWPQIGPAAPAVLPLRVGLDLFCGLRVRQYNFCRPDGRVTLPGRAGVGVVPSRRLAPEALAKRDRVEVASTSRNVAVVSFVCVEGPKFVVVDRTQRILVDARSGKVHASSTSSSSEPQRAARPRRGRGTYDGRVFVAACCSQPRRDYVYCVTEEGFCMLLPRRPAFALSESRIWARRVPAWRLIHT